MFTSNSTVWWQVKHDVKARLTLSATGTVGSAEDQRTHIQVLANSIVATVLILLHARLIGSGNEDSFFSFGRQTPAADVLVVGIVAYYSSPSSFILVSLMYSDRYNFTIATTPPSQPTPSPPNSESSPNPTPV